MKKQDFFQIVDFSQLGNPKIKGNHSENGKKLKRFITKLNETIKIHTTKYHWLYVCFERLHMLPQTNFDSDINKILSSTSTIT